MTECTKWKRQSIQGEDSLSYKISYQNLFWLFMLSSVAGFVVEGVWCIVRKGAWESHSATVWGPFCIVYGLGAIVIYMMACVLNKKNDAIQFIGFAVAGSVIEFFSGLFQECCFGSTSWNYSKHFLNIGGRVSLQMSLAWGALGILFVRLFFPLLNCLFSKMRGKFWMILCISATVFMAVNLIVSAAAVMRWSKRIAQEPAANRVEQFLDDTYDDDTMERLYPNMVFFR